MKMTEHIKKANGNTLFSFEIIPPKKGNSIQELYDCIDPLMEFKPPFIDVTTSREEFVYVDKGNGLLDRKITRTRQGTLGICAAIKHKYDLDTVPHVLCGGEQDLEDILRSFKFDVRIIGDEYKDKNYTGRDYCEGKGIELYYNSRDHRFSSSGHRKQVKSVEDK